MVPEAMIDKVSVGESLAGCLLWVSNKQVHQVVRANTVHVSASVLFHCNISSSKLNVYIHHYICYSGIRL